MTRVEEIPPDTRPDEPSLRELCRTIDARRAEYIRRLYGADWLDAAHYDLSIDTSRVDHETVADIIESGGRARHDPAGRRRPTAPGDRRPGTPGAGDHP